MNSAPGVAISVNRVPMRLTDERWQHIIEGHADLDGYYQNLLQVIERPEAVFEGRGGSLIAVRSYGRRGHLAVFYRELDNDGFVITARFLGGQPTTRRVWPKK